MPADTYVEVSLHFTIECLFLMCVLVGGWGDKSHGIIAIGNEGTHKIKPIYLIWLTEGTINLKIYSRKIFDHPEI